MIFFSLSLAFPFLRLHCATMKSAAEATAAQAEAMPATGHQAVFSFCVFVCMFFVRVLPNASVNSTRDVKRAETSSLTAKPKWDGGTTTINSDLFMTNLFIYWILRFVFPFSTIARLTLSLPVETQTNTRTHFENTGFRWNHKPESNASSNKPVQKNVCNIFVEIAGRFVWPHSLGYTAKFIVNVKANRKNVRFGM